MIDFRAYDVVSKTPDWSGVPREKLVEFLSKKYRLTPEEASALMRIAADWAYDNENL